MESLREMEKQIQRDLEDSVNTYTANRTTLNSFFDAYIETKYELKQSTRTNYKYMYKKYVSEDLGLRDIASIRYSDIKEFYYIVCKIAESVNFTLLRQKQNPVSEWCPCYRK